MRGLLGKSLRDERHGLIGWGVGLVALVAMMLAYYPTVRNSPELNHFLRALPQGVRALVGGTVDYTSADGYLNGEVFSLMLPLLMLTYSIALGSNLICREEERGTIDVLLSCPISRTRVVALKALAGAIGVFVLAALVCCALSIGAPAAGMSISELRLIGASASVMLLGLLFGALALALSGAFGARRSTRGAAIALAALAYLLNSFAPLISSLRPLRKFSPFYWYGSESTLHNGMNLLHAGFLAAGSLVLVLGAIIAFNRRDIAA